MAWPDNQTAGRAVAVCRTVAAAAGAPLNPVVTPTAPSPAAALRPLLVGTLLPAALQALARAGSGDSELLLLVRSLWMACQGDSPSPADVLCAALPSVTPQQIEQVSAGGGARATLKRIVSPPLPCR